VGRRRNAARTSGDDALLRPQTPRRWHEHQAAHQAPGRIAATFRKRALAVKGCRTIGKRDMIHNSATPTIEVDPETYEVRADGELLTCEPAQVLPLTQRYFLF